MTHYDPTTVVHRNIHHGLVEYEKTINMLKDISIYIIINISIQDRTTARFDLETDARHRCGMTNDIMCASIHVVHYTQQVTAIVCSVRTRRISDCYCWMEHQRMGHGLVNYLHSSPIPELKMDPETEESSHRWQTLRWWWATHAIGNGVGRIVC